MTGRECKFEDDWGELSRTRPGSGMARWVAVVLLHGVRERRRNAVIWGMMMSSV